VFFRALILPAGEAGPAAAATFYIHLINIDK
jgi:hypothetical protein